jgi:hypothetical protein
MGTTGGTDYMNEWTAPATIISIATLLGLGHLGPKAARRVWGALTGGARRARAEHDRLIAERDAARDELDTESTWRRILQEALSATRIVAMNHGVPETALPAYPARPRPPMRR